MWIETGPTGVTLISWWSLSKRIGGTYDAVFASVCARHSSSARLVQGALSAPVMAFAHCSTELSFLSTLAARLELALVKYAKTRMSLHPLERVMAWPEKKESLWNELASESTSTSPTVYSEPVSESLLNQSISCFVIGVVFLLVVSLFLLNLASVVREWVKLSRLFEQRFWGSGYHEGLMRQEHSTLLEKS